MNRIVAFCFISTVALCASAKVDPEMAEKVRQAKERIAAMSPAEREAYYWQKQMKRFGGWCIREGSGKGSVAFVNTTKVLDSEIIKGAAAEIEDLLCCKLVVKDSEAKVSVENAEKELLRSGSEIAIFVVDDEKLPSVLVATESDWAILNVRPFRKDNPSADKFKVRMEKELWRVFGQLCGSADTTVRGCVLKPINNVDDLDKLPGHFICPAPLQAIKDHLEYSGVKSYTKETYQYACQQGWAHAPTNEYQKAIWEKVKAEKNEKPSNPIVIKPSDKPSGNK